MSLTPRRTSRPTRPAGGRRIALCLGILIGLSCASSGGGQGVASSDAALTQADFTEVAETNSYEIVRQLRPRWLRARASRTPGNPTPRVGVVIDGRAGLTLDDLRSVSLTRVERIVFMSSSDATTRYGTGYTGGAIVVTILKR